MQGRRLPDCDISKWPDNAQPGDYFKMVHKDVTNSHLWGIVAPNGNVGTISTKIHTITEHADGTITVAPSIQVREPGNWHGYLRAGVWSEA